jgi:glycosyltransferase involved in cell wall biosynthesis
VGFDVGGIPDMVRPGSTGCIIPVKDIVALGSTILELLQDSQKLKNLALSCRQIAIKKYSMKIQAIQYLGLYKKMLEEEKAK